MQAWTIPNMTGIQNLQLTTLPDPVPAPGHALVTLHYAALNPADRYLAEGQYPAKPTFPHILGRDGVGTILAVNPAAGMPTFNLRPGDKAMLLRSDVGVNVPGTFAQLVSVPIENLAPIPSSWSEPQAAGATLVYLTAYQALTQWLDPPLPNPAIVLITGASGGVGVASVQLAKALGHTVIALSRSEEKGRRLLTLGADVVFDPADKLWSKNCRDWLSKNHAHRRVDLAIDNIGGPLLPLVIDCLAMNGRVSLVGRLAGPVPNFNTAALFFRRLRIGGVAVGTYTNEQTHAAWADVLKLMAKTNALPIVDHIFPFDQLPAAFDRLAQGPMGKVLLKVD